MTTPKHSYNLAIDTTETSRSIYHPTRIEEYPGCLIAFEGADGVGKTTLLERVAEEIPALILAFPKGDGDPFNAWNNILGDDAIMRPNHYEASAYFAADLWYGIRTAVLPALAEGQLVICDRFTWSSLVYQAKLGEMDGELAKNLYQRGGAVISDLTLWVDTPVDEALRRLSKAKDLSVLDKAPREFHQKVHDEYKLLFELSHMGDEYAYLGAAERIDGVADPDENFERVTALIRELLAQKKTRTLELVA